MERHEDMKHVFALIIAAFFASPADAHGPTPQTWTETIEIAAPPAQVWAAVKDFADLGWHPAVAASKGGGNTVGAEREINLKSGAITDSLDEYDPAVMSYTYRLAKENPETLPVSFYSATLTVKPSGQNSTVEWVARFYRADTGNYPPDHLNDEAAMNAIRAFFRMGLEGLKQKEENGRRAPS
jgi:mxaD protein